VTPSSVHQAGTDSQYELMTPSSVHQVGTVAKYELLKYLRGKRVLAIIVLTVLISAIFLIVPPAVGSGYSKDPSVFAANMLQASFVSILSILVVLSATLFGADAIVSEFESKTGYFLFPNPTRKTTIFIGKFLASAFVSVCVITFYYAITVVSVRAIDGSIPANTDLSFAYALVYLFAILAVAYLFSAVMRSSVWSLVLTFFTFFLILPIIEAVGSTAKFKPWFSLTFAGGIATNILKNPYPTDVVPSVSSVTNTSAAVSIGVAQYYPSVNLSLAVMAVYFVAAFLLAFILVQRREM